MTENLGAVRKNFKLGQHPLGKELEIEEGSTEKEVCKKTKRMDDIQAKQQRNSQLTAETEEVRRAFEEFGAKQEYDGKDGSAYRAAFLQANRAVSLLEAIQKLNEPEFFGEQIGLSRILQEVWENAITIGIGKSSTAEIGQKKIAEHVIEEWGKKEKGRINRGQIRGNIKAMQTWLERLASSLNRGIHPDEEFCIQCIDVRERRLEEPGRANVTLALQMTWLTLSLVAAMHGDLGLMEKGGQKWQEVNQMHQQIVDASLVEENAKR